MAELGYNERLPRHGSAVIPPRKLRDYLLDLGHPVGRHKAVYLARLGFSRRRWRALDAELRRLITREPAWGFPVEPYGQKLQVRGTIRGPWKRSGSVVTVWIIETPESAPRFVTAFPGSSP